MSNEASILDESTDFSLVLGGPLYQLYLGCRIAKPPMEWLHRRVAAMVTIPWLPLLILSGIAGTLFRGPAIPFPRDVGTQVRFLIALPSCSSARKLSFTNSSPLSSSIFQFMI